MAIKRPKPEEIVVKLRQVEVLMGQGMPRMHTLGHFSAFLGLDRVETMPGEVAQSQAAQRAQRALVQHRLPRSDVHRSSPSVF